MSFFAQENSKKKIAKKMIVFKVDKIKILERKNAVYKGVKKMQKLSQKGFILQAIFFPYR